MEDLAKRVQELRKQHNLSQVELAKRIEVSKAQMNRYENKGVQPPADVLSKMADILQTSVDYLIHGDSQEKAKASLKNTELLQKLKEMENLPDAELDTLMKVIGAYIRDFKTRQAYA